jgi:hypothetical protein
MFLSKYLLTVLLFILKYFAALVIFGNYLIYLFKESKTFTQTPWVLKNRFNLVSAFITLGLTFTLKI